MVIMSDALLFEEPKDQTEYDQLFFWLNRQENELEARRLILRFDAITAIDRSRWLLVARALRSISECLFHDFEAWTNKFQKILLAEYARPKGLSYDKHIQFSPRNAREAWYAQRPSTICDEPEVAAARVYARALSSSTVASTWKDVHGGDGPAADNRFFIDRSSRRAAENVIKSISYSLMEGRPIVFKEDPLSFYLRKIQGQTENINVANSTVTVLAAVYETDDMMNLVNGEFVSSNGGETEDIYDSQNSLLAGKDFRGTASDGRHNAKSEQDSCVLGKYLFTEDIPATIMVGDVLTFTEKDAVAQLRSLEILERRSATCKSSSGRSPSLSQPHLNAFGSNRLGCSVCGNRLGCSVCGNYDLALPASGHSNSGGKMRRATSESESSVRKLSPALIPGVLHVLVLRVDAVLARLCVRICDGLPYCWNGEDMVATFTQPDYIEDNHSETQRIAFWIPLSLLWRVCVGRLCPPSSIFEPSHYRISVVGDSPLSNTFLFEPVHRAATESADERVNSDIPDVNEGHYCRVSSKSARDARLLSRPQGPVLRYWIFVTPVAPPKVALAVLNILANSIEHK